MRNAKKQVKDLLFALFFDDEKAVRNTARLLLPMRLGALYAVLGIGDRQRGIDFKFGKPSPKYQKQIDEYVDLLTKMGYEAQGHIWYVGVPEEL